MAYKKASRQTLLPAIFEPHNDPEVPPDRCPMCGQCYVDTHIATPFDPTLSAALDSLTIATEALSHAKAVLEEVVL
jgi:hypothetical protein